MNAKLVRLFWGGIMSDEDKRGAAVLSARFFELPAIPDALREAGTRRHLDKGERISMPDGGWNGCYCVLSGVIGTYGIDRFGVEFLTFILEEGCLFLESDMLEGAQFAESEVAASFVAEQDTELRFIPQNEFQALMCGNTDVACCVALSIAHKMQAFRTLLNESRLHDALWRVANLFAGLADQYGIRRGTRIEIDFDISQQLVGKMLGINRITVAKSMRQLKELGLIEKTDDHYYLKDRNGLDAFLETFR